MARHYSLLSFLRKADKGLLRRYLTGEQLSEGIDWDAFTTRHLDPVFNVIAAASDDLRSRINRDFNDIWELGSEGGTKTIIDEGLFHGLQLARTVSEWDDPMNVAFWTFLEHPRVFDVACKFNYSDNLPKRSWRKRIDIDYSEPATDDDSKERLGCEIAAYYFRKEGRGRVCHVDHYRRGDMLYWFAHPQDYASSSLEYDENSEFQQRTIRPAFEVIFVFETEFMTLDTFIQGSGQTVEDLEQIWGQVILGIELGPPTYQKGIFDLDPLKKPGFNFRIDPMSGIEDVSVKKLRFKIPGSSNQRLALEADPRENKNAVYDLLNRVIADGKISLDHIFLTNVTLQFVFRSDGRRHSKTINCDLSYPNGCSLKHDPKDEIARQHLIDWGIDVSGCVTTDTD